MQEEQRKMKSMKADRRGFTLIELMISLTIIVIIMAIAIPNYQKAGEKAQLSGCAGNQKIIMAQLESYFLVNNNYPTLSMDVLTATDLSGQITNEDFAEFLLAFDLGEKIAGSENNYLHAAYQSLDATDTAKWYILDMAKMQEEGYLQDLVICPKGGLYMMSLNDKGRAHKVMCTVDGNL